MNIGLMSSFVSLAHYIQYEQSIHGRPLPAILDRDFIWSSFCGCIIDVSTYTFSFRLYLK